MMQQYTLSRAFTRIIKASSWMQSLLIADMCTVVNIFRINQNATCLSSPLPFRIKLHTGNFFDRSCLSVSSLSKHNSTARVHPLLFFFGSTVVIIIIIIVCKILKSVVVDIIRTICELFFFFLSLCSQLIDCE